MSDSGPVSRAEQTERTKDTIVDAVVDLIEAHGRFTIAEVSDRSAISPATIYRHYPDRTALLAAVARANDFQGPVKPESLAEWRAILADVWSWQQRHFSRIFAISATPIGREMRAKRMRERESLMTEQLHARGIDANTPAGRRMVLLWQIIASSRAFIDLHEVFDVDAADAAEMAGWAVTALVRATEEGWEIGNGLD